MNDSYTAALKEAFAIAPSKKVIYQTLEFRQDDVQDRIYLIQSRRRVTAYDEDGIARTFEPGGFQFSLPPATEEGITSLALAIDNVGQRISSFITLAMSEVVPVQVIYRPYLSTDLSQPQMDPPLVMFLKDIQVNIAQVTAKANFIDLVNKKFPNDLYTRDRFPSLG